MHNYPSNLSHSRVWGKGGRMLVIFWLAFCGRSTSHRSFVSRSSHREVITKERRTSARGCPMLPRPPGQVQILLRELIPGERSTWWHPLQGKHPDAVTCFFVRHQLSVQDPQLPATQIPFLCLFCFQNESPVLSWSPQGLFGNGNHYLNRKHTRKHHFCSSYCS